MYVSTATLRLNCNPPDQDNDNRVINNKSKFILFIITSFVYDDCIDRMVCCYTEWKGSMVI